MTALRRLNPVYLFLLLAAALALRIAVPAGFMPVADDDGLRVEICTGGIPTAITLDPGKSDRDPPRDPCPYGVATAAGMDVPPPIAPHLVAPTLSPLRYPGLSAARLTAWRALRPPARGPPTFA